MNVFLTNAGVLTVLLIFVFSLAILAGYEVYKVTRAKAKIEGDEKTEEKDPADESQPRADAPKETDEHPKFEPPNRRWEEIAHLWRDPRDGRLIFQIGDESYKYGTDLTPKERKILLKVVMDFYRWLEPPSPAKPQPPESTPPAPSEPLPLVMVPPEEPPEMPRGFSPAAMIADALQSAVPTPPPQMPSIVMQIDAILQEKLKEADMQKWAVRLVELPDRGMVVLVGLEQYDGIDDVPYKPVKQVIRASVLEWEERVTEQTSNPQRKPPK
jgi:hypothetical protein